MKYYRPLGLLRAGALDLPGSIPGLLGPSVGPLTDVSLTQTLGLVWGVGPALTTHFCHDTHHTICACSVLPSEDGFVS